MFVFSLFCKIHDSHNKQYVMEELESLLYMILYGESRILDASGLEHPKIGGGQRILHGGPTTLI